MLDRDRIGELLAIIKFVVVGHLSSLSAIEKFHVCALNNRFCSTVSIISRMIALIASRTSLLNCRLLAVVASIDPWQLVVRLLVLSPCLLSVHGPGYGLIFRKYIHMAIIVLSPRKMLLNKL